MDKTKIFIPLVLAVFVAALHAQTTQTTQPAIAPLTKVGQMADAQGSLIQKQIIDIGFVRGIRVQAVVVNDLTMGRRATGVRFEAAGTPPTMIDPDEVDSIIRAIDTMRTSILNTYPDTYTDAFYTAKDGFTVGAYFVERAWHASLRINKFENSPSIIGRPEDLTQLIELLQQAKPKIK